MPALSAYTHLWNTAGFPAWHVDESIYTKRALDAPDHKILSDMRDHAFLGWAMLAGFMHVAGCPDSLARSWDAPSLGMFYGDLCILVVLPAVLDAFLTCKMAEGGLGRRTAPIAAVLFATMPASLAFRPGPAGLDPPPACPLLRSACHVRTRPGSEGRFVRGGGPLSPSPDRIRLLIVPPIFQCSSP